MASRSVETVKIATFNIRDFGRTKAAKPEVMKTLAEIVRKYDLVAFQEVSDTTGTAVNALRKTIADQGGVYDLEVSERSGSTASESAKEQYAFFYNTTTIEPDGEGGLFDDRSDQFKREPFVARFKTKHGNFTFVLISIHTEPKTTVDEIDALDDVFTWAAKRFPKEDDFIALGDFNAACSYATPGRLDATRLRQPGYTWVVPDDADTNLAQRACAYDRIVFREGTKTDFAGTWGSTSRSRTGRSRTIGRCGQSSGSTETTDEQLFRFVSVNGVLTFLRGKVVESGQPVVRADHPCWLPPPSGRKSRG
jgi:endonuclease/exonuclease/phosphatase family metal-dependent hydrolase